MYTYIDQHINESLSFLELIVNQNSFTSNKKGSDKVNDILVEQLNKIGFKTQRRPVKEVGDILIASNETESKTKPILISAHVDTVHPEDSDFKYFKKEGNKIFGPGIFDMKGSIAMLLLSLEALKAEGLLNKIPLKLIFNSDEETGSQHSAEMILETSKSCSHALVLEPARPNNGILTSRKGRIKGNFICRGVPAHAGNDISKGANAIVQISHIVKLINEINDPAKLISANVGLISGGVATNVVPDTCSINFEVRFAKSADLEKIRKRISEIAEAIIVDRTRLEYKEESYIPSLDQTDLSLKLAKAYINAAKTLNQNLTLFPEIAGGTSDANFMAPAGIAIIDGLGLIGAGAHTKQEYIEVDSLATRTKALTAWLSSAKF